MRTGITPEEKEIYKKVQKVYASKGGKSHSKEHMSKLGRLSGKKRKKNKQSAKRFHIKWKQSN